MKGFSFELLELITSYCSRSKEIASLSQVNHHFYSAVTRLLYKHVTINAPRQYLAFKSSRRELKRFVIRLDFSSFTTRGSRWTEEKAKSIIIASELADLISECNQLKELFVGEEMMHAFVLPRVMQSIFRTENNLVTIDLVGFCDYSAIRECVTPLVNEQQLLVTSTPQLPKKLENISFYMCMALSLNNFFIPFFDKLSLNENNLKRLDLSFTKISSQLFLHLTKNQAKSLTHLNLQSCYSLSCCSPLVTFLEKCNNLIQLNLNIKTVETRFCHDCIYRILKNKRLLISLDMGGHVNFDDSIIIQDLSSLGKQLKYLSIEYCKNISLNVLFNYLPLLFYLNLSNTPLSMDLPRVFNQTTHQLQVIEISQFNLKRYPNQLLLWKLSTQGKRSFYSKNNVDPRFIYSKKLLLNNNKLSQMNKYWSYSF